MFQMELGIYSWSTVSTTIYVFFAGYVQTLAVFGTPQQTSIGPIAIS